MELKRIVLSGLRKDPSEVGALAEEAFRYGVSRGGSSAAGDRYATFGGPSFDMVIRDYLSKKFGITGDLIELSKAIPTIPEPILERLRAGFDDGYTDYVRKQDSAEFVEA